MRRYQLCDVLGDLDYDPIKEAGNDIRFQKHLKWLSELPKIKKRHIWANMKAGYHAFFDEAISFDGKN